MMTVTMIGTEQLTTRTVTAAGTKLFVREWGQPGGETILFWHALGTTGLHLNEIGPVLASEHGFFVVAPDWPGFGRSPALGTSAYHPAALAALAGETLTALGIVRAVFLGHSWGATVGCYLAATQPERLTALVLLDGGYLDLADVPDFDSTVGLARLTEQASELHRQLRFPSWEHFFDEERKHVRRWSQASAESARSQMEEQDGMIVPVVTPTVVAAVQQGLCDAPAALVLTAVGAHRIPVLLLRATEPPQLERVRARCVERLRAAIPHACVESLRGYGHDVITDGGPGLAQTIAGRLTAIRS